MNAVSPPAVAGTLALDAEALYVELKRAVQALLAAGPQPTHLVGVATGGAWLAERLQRELGLPGQAGVVVSTLHRDDYAQRGLSASAAQTHLPFDVEGAHILLIDDVLYTGRTLRAVLNELFDHGRPASVRLAVLVDRGLLDHLARDGRERYLAWLPDLVERPAEVWLVPMQHGRRVVFRHHYLKVYRLGRDRHVLFVAEFHRGVLVGLTFLEAQRWQYAQGKRVGFLRWPK